jgi:hypothetical protein
VLENISKTTCQYAILLLPSAISSVEEMHIGKGVVPCSIFAFQFSVQRGLYVRKFQMLYSATHLAGN